MESTGTSAASEGIELTRSAGHAGVITSSLLKSQVGHLVKAGQFAERTAIGTARHSLHRVAIPEKDAKARAGGLEVAVKAALKCKSGIWFGWSGKVATHTKIATQKVVHGKITYVTLDLSKEDYQEYYNGFTDRALWPILHYRIDLAEFSRRDLSGYLRVNDNFASESHEVLGPDDLIWVHDYHLMPLAKALRERGHQNRTAFSFIFLAHRRRY